MSIIIDVVYEIYFRDGLMQMHPFLVGFLSWQTMTNVDEVSTSSSLLQTIANFEI